ncbi:protein FAM177A1 isoform X2 [Betta splendens]|nr:protein FAM177A1 isoform X2 [Betta splendens]XP_028997029.1 protein FAM177A1 isoform X2 [Betta splendens]XP_055362365.1 protein FAM177A1 isoform X2 [Betta splendens]
MDIQETQFEDPAPSKQRRIIHFSSGETLELEDSDEEDKEEQFSSTPPFTESSDKARFSFRTLAILVGRMSLLTCDFLGERLAGVLGLNAAKYQYAIDRYHHDHKEKSGHAKDDLTEGRAERTNLSNVQARNHYGATRDAGCSTDCVEKHRKDHKGEGYHNKGYQVDEDWK